jgi:hypothetical protein
MNQTESRRKREGSGVGIPCEEARCLAMEAPPSHKANPGSRFRAYLTAPDETT